MNHWPQRLLRWKPEFDQAATEFTLAVELIAAICDRESGGGIFLTPPGPGGTGDSGHGHGLMQIDDRSHGDWLMLIGPDGTPLWQDPLQNILYGSGLLHDYIAMFNGSVAAGVCCYNAGPARVQHIMDTVGEDIYALNTLTTGHDYVSDVLNRSAALQEIALEG